MVCLGVINMDNKFIKIRPFGDRNNQEILEGVVEKTEKLDGANGSIMIKDGQLVMRSRNNELINGLETGKNCIRAWEFVRSIHEETPFEEGLIYFGEILIRHTIIYGETPPFVGYSVYNIKDDRYIEDWYEHFISRDIETPSREYVNGLNAEEIIDKFGEIKSEFGTNDVIAEGFVIKNYSNQQFAKFVRDEFKEDNRKAFGHKEIQERQDNAYKIVERFCTSPRVTKGIHKLIEDDGMELEMQMMTRLPRVVFDDIIEEEFYAISHDYRDVSFGNMTKYISKKCVSGLKAFMIENSMVTG